MATMDALVPVLKKYIEEDPALAARNLEAMSEEVAAEVLDQLPISTASDVFCQLQPVFAAKVIRLFKPTKLADILKKTDAQHGSSLFLSLPPEIQQTYLDSMPEKFKEQIRELLTFPEGSAGRLMSPDFLAFRQEMLAKDAINKIRLLVKKKQKIAYVYVIDASQHLVGIMNMRDLMLAPSDAPLDKVMRTETFFVDAFMDQEQVHEELVRRNYLSAPVVDAEKRLLGVFNSDRATTSEYTEDIQKMFGAGGDERAFSPMGYTIKKRLPWLHVNLATAFMAAAVVALFEDIIAKITVLAVYLPVVAGQGGNAGAQSLAVVMRGLVMREIPPNSAGKLILKETIVGTINGVVIGIVTALIAWFWQGNPYMGLVIGLGMIVNMAIAGFAGAAIPLGMKAIRLDPAQCSNIILTTITDVMGFFAFLGFAVLFQHHLI